MKEEILSIASDLREGSMTTNEAKEQLLVLFGVVGRSEQLTCKHGNIIMNSATTGYCDDCKNSIDFLAG